MRTVKEGDKYCPENNEVVNIEYQGNTITCVCITDCENQLYDPETLPCTGCPLERLHQSTCKEWLFFGKPHRVIPVEDVVE